MLDWPPETEAIEVMGTHITKPKIIPRLMRECKEHGFSPFHVKKNSNGYIYNRYVHPSFIPFILIKFQDMGSN